jgi:prevent-host-death family protein
LKEGTVSKTGFGQDKQDKKAGSGFAEEAAAFDWSGLAAGAAAAREENVWGLREAKAQLSEVVRRAQTLGPQRVTVRGREDVVVLSARDYERLKGALTGQVVLDALAACPHPDFEFERVAVDTVLRDVEW